MPVEEIVKISRNYQVTIPVRVRQKFQINTGDLVRIIYDENEKVIKVKKLDIKKLYDEE